MAGKISTTRGAMLFNHRVLELGTVPEDGELTVKELSKALQFNDIFRSNSDEIFQRTSKFTEIDLYVQGIATINRNLTNLMNHIRKTDPNTVIDNEDNFECRLTTELRVSGLLTSEYVFTGEPVGFVDSQLYYLTPMDGYIVSTTAPKSSPIYSKPFSYRYSDHTKYWKTDACIRNYLSERLAPTITARVISSRDTGKPTKVEVEGDPAVIREVVIRLFPEDILVVRNPFLYTGDISQILESMEPESKSDNSVPDHPLFELSDLLEREMVVSYPETPFDVYLRFLSLASLDPNVTKISMFLYRIGDNPVMFYILRDAVRRGKQVFVNLETQASGELINRFWALEMKRAGIDVSTYAEGTLKVHAKLTLVEFNDGRSILQVGTGNYHCTTTERYTDLSYFTPDPVLCEAASQLFSLVGNRLNQPPEFNDRFLVTGFNARETMEYLIEREMYKGRDGYIAIKCNAFDDERIIEKLQQAAEAGCTVELIVRGLCTWDPGDLLDNGVRIRSFVWDRLEHSRIYQFGRENPTVYVGSLDPIYRKIGNRIETLVKVSEGSSLDAVVDYLEKYLEPSTRAWEMYHDSDGTVSYRKELS